MCGLWLDYVPFIGYGNWEEKEWRKLREMCRKLMNDNLYLSNGFLVFSLWNFSCNFVRMRVYIYVYSVGEEREKTPKSSYQTIAWVTRELAKSWECLTQQTFELHSCAPHVTFHKLK